MTMRLTGNSNFLLFQRALSLRNSDVFRSSEQLSTQKRINRASDDPEGARVALGYQQSIESLEQYLKNLDSGERFLRDTEAALTSAKDLIVRAKELAIQGRNGILSSQARDAIATEVQQLLQQMALVGNTEVNGEYLFSGYRTNTRPFSLDAAQPSADPVATYGGDANARSIRIGESSTLQIQSRGDEVFKGDGSPSTVDIFQTLADLQVALDNDNVDDNDPASVGSMIDDLDTGLNQMLAEITAVGARINRIELNRSHFETQREVLKGFLTSIVEVDLSEAAFNYQKANTALQATVTAAGNIMNVPSLMDFIR